MSTYEKWLSRKVIADITSSTEGVPGAGNVLRCFPTRKGHAHRSRELGRQLLAVVFIGDILVLVSALLLSFCIRFQTPIREWGINARPEMADYLGYIVLASTLYVGMLCYGGVYNRRNLLQLRTVTAQILKWSVAWVGLILLGSFMVKFQPPVSRAFCVMAWVITPTILVIWRAIFHQLLTHASALSTLQQRVVFVGWNQESARLAQNFKHSFGTVYKVVGYIHAQAHRTAELTIPYLGAIEEAERIISSVGIDVLILADPDYEQQWILHLAKVCEREMIEFKVVPSYFQILVSDLHLETVSGTPILGVTRLPLDRIVNRALKRATDIVGAIVGLLLSLPLIAIFGAIVYLESPGPVFYRQRRTGRNGKAFDIVKIRSMRLDAERDGKAGWTVRDDPRRLKIRALMRQWNIDEAPQFWNVLKGEMSLVGPRPERPELIATFKHEIPYYNARHNAKPGITGWSQIHGLRGNTDLSERINYDLWYLENWSVILDLQIMCMTFFRHQNAG